MREGNDMNDKPIDFQLLPAPPSYALWVSAETNEMSNPSRSSIEPSPGDA
jgi:hypothetical protein